MPLRVEHHPHVGLRLVRGHARSGLRGPGDPGLEIIDPDVEVKPTFHGESWSGNSYDAKANTPGKIDDKKINAWRNEISAEDAAIIAREAAFEMSLVGYKD